MENKQKFIDFLEERHDEFKEYRYKSETSKDQNKVKTAKVGIYRSMRRTKEFIDNNADLLTFFLNGAVYESVFESYGTVSFFDRDISTLIEKLKKV
jgi:hypothetical protein